MFHARIDPMKKQELLKLWRVMANGGDPFPYLNYIALEAQIEHIIPTDGEKDSEGIEQRLLLQYGVHKDGQAVGMVYPPHHVVGISTTFKDPDLRYYLLTILATWLNNPLQ